MDNFDRKLKSSLEQEPSYDNLDCLRQGVWEKVRKTRDISGSKAQFNLTLTPAMKAFSLVLVLGSCFALSQISFDKGVEPDLFDLRYFSHQSLATTNLLTLNAQGPFP